MENNNRARFELCNDPNCFGTKLNKGKRHWEIWNRAGTKHMPLFSFEAALMNLDAGIATELIAEEEALLIIQDIVEMNLPDAFQPEDELVVAEMTRQIQPQIESFFLVFAALGAALKETPADSRGVGFEIQMPGACRNGCHILDLIRDGRKIDSSRVRDKAEVEAIFNLWGRMFKVPKRTLRRLTEQAVATTEKYNAQLAARR